MSKVKNPSTILPNGPSGLNSVETIRRSGLDNSKFEAGVLPSFTEPTSKLDATTSPLRKDGLSPMQTNIKVFPKNTLNSTTNRMNKTDGKGAFTG
jgi:hypothetical protein